MTTKLQLCTCEHLSTDHIGRRGRCQHQPTCSADCQRFARIDGSNKYGARREVNADSKLEADRFRELALLLRAGQIRDLRLHHRLDVEPPGCRRITYKADATYEERRKDGTWVWVIEDTKSDATKGGRWPVVWQLARCRYPHALLRVSERPRGRGQGFTLHDEPPRAVAAEGGMDGSSVERVGGMMQAEAVNVAARPRRRRTLLVAPC
jgi:hypothetical protein